ncbi:hypothetical protein EDB89DRAFT_2064259 [Lactarius sanguifluus]|nr:hypothetical protein EDB89DRAFT_2064259 [Lactarius sanguifluus]
MASTFLPSISKHLSFIVFFPDFELLVCPVENYFNELDEFNQLFTHDDQLIYLVYSHPVYSHLVFHPNYPSFNI